MRRTGSDWMAGAAALLIALPAPAQTIAAQTIAAQTVAAQAVAPPTREEVQRAAPPAVAAPGRRVTVATDDPPAPCPLSDPALAGRTVRVVAVRFNGLEEVGDAALRPAWAAQAGRTIPLSGLCAIRDRAAELLRAAGYVAAVRVPAQDAASGIIRLDVVMGHVARIEIVGDVGPSRAKVAAMLAPLAGGRLFKRRLAERALLLVRTLPGYDVALRLRPGAVEGELIGEATVARTPLTVAANLQNYGARALGRWGALVTVQANDPAGIGDRLTLGAFSSLQPREQTVAQAGYEVHPGHHGLTLAVRGTFVRTHPTTAPDDPLRSRTWVGALEAAYPLRLGRRLDLRGAGGIELIGQDLDYQRQPYTRDRLRTLFARLDVVALDARAAAPPEGGTAPVPRWRLAASVEVRRGLGILGATGDCGAGPVFAGCPTFPTPSRLAGSAEAGLVRLSAVAEIQLDTRVALVLQPRAQRAFAPLLNYEQYSVGAYSIGRGYDPGIAIGDDGVGTAGEVCWTLGGRLRLEPYLFGDAAWVRNRADGGYADGDDHVVSVGAGVRGVVAGRARLDLAYARPLHRTAFQDVRGHGRLLLSLTTRIAP